MSAEAIKEMLPDYARDLRLNLSSLFNASPLTEQQLWGTVAAVAAAGAPSPAVSLLDEESRQHLAPEAHEAAHAAAAIMAMNNVYYRSKHLLSDMGVTSYDSVPPRLRMQVIGIPRRRRERGLRAVVLRRLRRQRLRLLPGLTRAGAAEGQHVHRTDPRGPSCGRRGDRRLRHAGCRGAGRRRLN